MTKKFAREKDLVERLVQRLGLAAEGYEDPNASGLETGADLTVLLVGRRIGVQVTILDTGAAPGKAIAAEKAQARETLKFRGGVYGDEPKRTNECHRSGNREKGGNRRHRLRRGLAARLLWHPRTWSRRLNLCGDELADWRLTVATSRALLQSSYDHAFFHPITALEDALYEWTPAKQWQKHVGARPAPEGASFWDIQRTMKERLRQP